MPLFPLSTLVALLMAFDSPSTPAFLEMAEETGLDFVHFSGMAGHLHTAELLGAGVAVIDYDNDGDLDVYLGQGGRLGADPEEVLVFEARREPPLTDRLFRNDFRLSDDGSPVLGFTDVTDSAGLEAFGYNVGVATGDVDRDGFVDLYVTNLGSNHLLRNRGNGTFEDVTALASADDRGLSVPAVFFDFDDDGWLDLFVGNYHRFRAAGDKQCFMPNGLRDYCGPLARPAQQDRLLRNRGRVGEDWGGFQDVTLVAGLGGRAATALGAVAADFNLDGWIDLYVANDLMANHLWLNQGDGTFVEDALLAGAAFDGDGKAQASMGVVAGDLNGDDFVDLFMSHLKREYNTLYLNDGRGLFTDRSQEGGMVRSSWPMTGFGTAILDFDGDSNLDLFVANGAVRRIEEQVREGEPHPLRMENQLWRGLGGGRFEEVPSDERQRPVYVEVSRGVAVGDLDNDGDPDLVISNNAGRTRLLLNQRQPQGDWLGVRLIGSVGAIDSYGARAAIVSDVGPLRWRRVHTDGSFAAAGDPRLILPLPREAASTVRVSWPGGELEDFVDIEPGRYVSLRQGAGRKVEK